jgi:hypothetical protein
MKKLLVGIAAAVVLTSCAQDLTHPPVYRGEYYTFDAYPDGYKGYPGYPYYGAPFGYGGPAFAATEQQSVQGNTKEIRTTRTSTRVHHSRTRRAESTSQTQESAR